MTNSNGQPAPTFKNQLYIFTAFDTNSRYIFTKLCTNRVGVLDHLESLRLFIAATERTIQVIRTDNKFIISSAFNWALKHHVSSKVPVPFEHDTLQEMTY